MSKAITKQEALSKVAEVLEEALNEYEMLEKMDLELAEDPTRPSFPPADPKAAEAAEDEEDEEEDEQDEDEAEEDKDEKEEDKEKLEDEESDEAIKSEFAKAQAKMEKRGLLKSEGKKKEAKADDVKKSEAAPTPAPTEDKSEALKKSVDERFESLSKTIENLSKVVEKIASAPAPRKGVAGYTPLRKSEEGSQELSKSQTINKLLEMKKSGDRRVDTALINRVETDRVNATDLDTIKGILG